MVFFAPFAPLALVDILTVGEKNMRRDWLWSDNGLNVLAMGIVAIIFSLVLFTTQDVWILFTGKLFALTGLRQIYYPLWAALAALFSALTVFIWRPGFP